VVEGLWEHLKLGMLKRPELDETLEGTNKPLQHFAKVNPTQVPMVTNLSGHGKEEISGSTGLSLPSSFLIPRSMLGGSSSL